MLHTEALDQALTEADHARVDTATIQLARTYAEHLDDNPGDLAKIGPRLLDCLEALGFTPRARAKMGVTEEEGEKPVNPLDELRKRRAQRTNQG